MACGTPPRKPSGGGGKKVAIAPIQKGNPDTERRQINERLQQIANELSTQQQEAAAQVSAVQLESYEAKYDETVRVAPSADGLRLILPPPLLAKAGAEVSVLVESDAGPLSVECVDGFVNGEPSVTFAPGTGLIIFKLDGEAGWYSTTSTLTYPPTAPADAEYVVGATNASLPSARLAVSSPTIVPNLATAGSIAWDWRGLGLSAGTTSGSFTRMTLSNSNNVSFGLQINGVVTARAALDSVQWDDTVSGTLDPYLLPAGFKSGDSLVWVITGNVVLNRLRMSDDSVPPDGFLVYLSLRDQSGGSAPGFSITIPDTGAVTTNGSFRPPGQVQGTSPGPDYIMQSEEEGCILIIRAGNWRLLGGTAGQAITGPIVVSAGNGGVRTASFATNAASVGLTVNGSSQIQWLGAAFSAGAAAATRITGTLVFSDSNGVSFGRNGSTITASIASSLTNIRVSAGTTSNLLSAITFSNANGVSFGLNASTITASIATSLTAINLSAGTTSNNLSAFTLSNANNVSFGLNGSVVTASATVASTQASINLSAGTTSNLASAFTFSNSNSISFGLNAGTITATVSYPAQTSFVLSNSNNVTFGTAGSTVTASASFPAQTQFVLSNSNGLTWGTNVSTVTGSFSTLSYSNANGVTFGIAGSTLTASVAAGGAGGIAASAAGSSQSAGTVVWSNSNNVSFGMNGSTITASASFPAATAFVLSNSNGLSWGTAGSTVTGSFSTLSYSNANNVTFGIAGSTITASATVASTQASVRISAGTTNALSSAFTFGQGATNFNTAAPDNVRFGLNGNTITAIAPIFFSAGTTGFQQTLVSFSNANNVSWGIQTQAGSIPFVTASVTVASSQDSVRFSAGTTNNLASNWSFANSGAWRFGLNGSTITHDASVSLGQVLGLQIDAAGSGAAIPLTGQEVGELIRFEFFENTLANIAGTYNDLVVDQRTMVLFIDPTTDADVIITGIIKGLSNTGCQLLIIKEGFDGRVVLKDNATGSSAATNCFFLPGGQDLILDRANDSVLLQYQSTRWHPVGPQKARAAAGGSSVQLGQLSFSNANGVTWGLSTNSVGGTVTASVAAGGGGGIVVADELGSTKTNGTVVFNSGDIPGATSRAVSDNVAFQLTGDTIRASAFVCVGLGTTGAGNVGTRFDFMNANGISWSKGTTNMAGSGHIVTIEASFQKPVLSQYLNFGNGASVIGQLASDTYGSQIFRLSPLNRGNPFPGDMTVATAEFLVEGATVSSSVSSSGGVTLRGGIYTLANSTQLTLVNSFAGVFSRPAEGTTSRDNLVRGVRFMTVAASEWSSSPVFSEGVQYWIGLNLRTANVPLIHSIMNERQVPFDVAFNYRIQMGSSVSATAGSNFAPFWGAVSTNAPPVSIGSANVVSYSAPNQSSGMAPIFQFRNIARC